MGCYVLLQSKINCNEDRQEHWYAARNYQIGCYKSYTEEGTHYVLNHQPWHIVFTSSFIRFITDDRPVGHYYCRDNYNSVSSEVMELTGYLANCRFDLVYEHLNKQYGQDGLLCACIKTNKNH
jgi:hypothetical protein